MSEADLLYQLAVVAFAAALVAVSTLGRAPGAGVAQCKDEEAGRGGVRRAGWWVDS